MHQRFSAMTGSSDVRSFSASTLVELVELYCSVADPQKVNTQKLLYLRNALADAYWQDSAEAGLPRDPWKARRYAGLANPRRAGRRTALLYNGMGWLTSIRLFMSRVARLVTLSNVSLLQAATNNVTKLARIGGLSYGLELLFDGAVMLSATLFPANKMQFKGALRRFKNVFWKDNRPHRLLNAAVWFAVNLACFFVSGGLVSVLNISLYCVDVLNDGWKAFRQLHRVVQLEKVLNDNINALTENNFLTEVMRGKIEEYRLVKNNLLDKKQELTKIHGKQIVVSALILTGMGLFIFSPAGPALIVGASLAMAGSIFGGLGKRIYDCLFKKNQAHADDHPIPLRQPSRQNITRGSRKQMQQQLAHGKAKDGHGNSLITREKTPEVDGTYGENKENKENEEKSQPVAVPQPRCFSRELTFFGSCNHENRTRAWAKEPGISQSLPASFAAPCYVPQRTKPA